MSFEYWCHIVVSGAEQNDRVWRGKGGFLKLNSSKILKIYKGEGKSFKEYSKGEIDDFEEFKWV